MYGSVPAAAPPPLSLSYTPDIPSHHARVKRSRLGVLGALSMLAGAGVVYLDKVSSGALLRPNHGGSEEAGASLTELAAGGVHLGASLAQTDAEMCGVYDDDENVWTLNPEQCGPYDQQKCVGT